jgi:hypothetical protein
MTTNGDDDDGIGRIYEQGCGFFREDEVPEDVRNLPTSLAFRIPRDAPFAILNLRRSEDGRMLYRREVVRKICQVSGVPFRVLMENPLAEYLLLWSWLVLDTRKPDPPDEHDVETWAHILREQKRAIVRRPDLERLGSAVSIELVDASEFRRMPQPVE